MPKVVCTPAKLTAIVAYFQRSRVAHSIKDLEKQLPAVASVNGMQVKDYLQHLADESKIKVEKIGSGNWYWSFASEEKKIQEKLLTDAQSAHEKLDAIVADLKQKVADVQAQHEDDAEMLHSGVESRESLMAKQHALTKEVQALQKQLAAYSDSDPAELERKKVETKRAKAEFEQYTDEIYAMESWIQQHAGPEAVKILRAIFYGDEYDEEEGALRELA